MQASATPLQVSSHGSGPRRQPLSKRPGHDGREHRDKQRQVHGEAHEVPGLIAGVRRVTVRAVTEHMTKQPLVGRR